VRGRALEFADYRAYTPGDDPKLVDWRAYSRLGRLYLKQFEEERSRTLTLLVDISGSLGSGEGEAHQGLYARRLAAALAWISLSHHEPVRLHLLKGGGRTSLPPVSSRAGAVGLFRQLGSVQEGEGTALATSLRGLLPGGTPGPTLLLTDLMDPGWAEALDLLAGVGEAAVLQVMSPAEWEPPLGEEVELEDVETGELRATRLGPSELAAYRDRLHDFLAQVRRHCGRLGVSHVALNTAVPVQEAVLRHLPAAGILR
jgi:uncharacterized protein (DUF58 family)